MEMESILYQLPGWLDNRFVYLVVGLLALIVAAVGLFAAIYFFQGLATRCPSCKRFGVGEVISRSRVSRADRMDLRDFKKDTEVVVENRYRCTNCGHEWTTESVTWLENDPW